MTIRTELQNIMDKDADDYILKQIYRKKKSVKIELKKGRFKGNDGKYYSCLIAIFDNKFIVKDFGTECFEGLNFDEIKKKLK